MVALLIFHRRGLSIASRLAYNAVHRLPFIPTPEDWIPCRHAPLRVRTTFFANPGRLRARARWSSSAHRATSPCRKLIPSLFNLAKAGLLPKDFVVVGTAHDDLSEEQFRAQVTQFLSAADRQGETLELVLAEPALSPRIV